MMVHALTVVKPSIALAIAAALGFILTQKVPADDSPATPRPFELLVASPQGKPIPQAPIELRGNPLPAEEQITRGTFVRKHSFGIIIATDADGKLGVNLPAKQGHFNASMSIPGYAPYWAAWSNGANSELIPETFTAELDAAWSVGGIIVNESGRPIEGVRVRPSVRFKKRAGDMQDLGVGTTVMTDAEGKWRYDCVPMSKESVFVEINHTGFKPDRRSLARGEFGIGLGQPPTAKIALDRGLSVVGTVTDTDGNPIVGATIRTKLLNDIRETQTNELGTYRLSGLEPAQARIVVFAKGKATDMQEVRIEPDMEPLDFRMSPGGTVRIRVLDMQGRPVPKARIFFQRWRGRFSYFEFNHISQYADDHGLWVWNEAPLDMFEADICPPNGMQLGKQPLIAQDEEFVFRTPPLLVISGTVTDAETKQPVKAFTVVPGLRGEPGTEVQWTRSEQFVAKEGQYRVEHSHDYDARFVRIEAAGYQPAMSRPIKSDEGNVTIDFELRTGKDLAATVLTPDGMPVRGARVALGVAGSQIIVKNGEIDLGSTYCAKRETDDAGKFQFPLEEQPFQLVITHPAGYMHLDATSETFPATIKLNPWAKVEGIFRVGKDPAPRVNLTLYPTGLQSYGEGVPHVSASYEVPTDQNGHYVFDRVVPGPARLGRGILLMVNEGAKEVASSTRFPVDLSAGKTTHLDLGGTGRPVVAQLKPPPGHQGKVEWAFAMVDVSVWQPDLPPANPPKIPEGIRDNLLQRQQWMRQWQQTPEGRAWTAYRVAAQEQDRQSEANSHFWATVDRTGKVRFDDMPAGEYTLSVRFNENPAGRLFGYRFTVPPMTESRVDEPLDLGALTLQ